MTTATAPDVLEVIRRLSAVQRPRSHAPIEAGATLATLELDSIELLSLVVGLEDHFQVALREEDAAELTTVGELAALVSRRVEERAS